MTNLAIKGHPTRGSEVITLLEMLGGINEHEYDGNRKFAYYFIKNNYIDWCHECTPESNFISFTLEEFEEKFPYKVGDKVFFDNECFFIRKMYWENYQILYELSDEIYEEGSSIPDTLIFDVNVEKLQPYKEQKTMEEKDKSKAPILYNEDYANYTFGYKIPKEYEFIGVENNEIRIRKKKPQYPSNYDECCKVLGVNPDNYLSIRNLYYDSELHPPKGGCFLFRRQYLH